ncbi:unnamed protein product [Enterobius vermicularis]|uniref:G-patch domain-containing protein n=1 Tax=Enterobius vermicularis TaxID=51028 RepID=A0A0N4VQ15_ENTVE|nr:unnamed protein product [Enterobius vermicularis]
MEKNGYNQGKYRGKEEKRDKSVMEKHNNQSWLIITQYAIKTNDDGDDDDDNDDDDVDVDEDGFSNDQRRRIYQLLND